MADKPFSNDLFRSVHTSEERQALLTTLRGHLNSLDSKSDEECTAILRMYNSSFLIGDGEHGGLVVVDGEKPIKTIRGKLEEILTMCISNLEGRPTFGDC